jgi:hypothetical protein
LNQIENEIENEIEIQRTITGKYKQNEKILKIKNAQFHKKSICK